MDGGANDRASTWKSRGGEANVETSSHGLLYKCEPVVDCFNKRN